MKKLHLLFAIAVVTLMSTLIVGCKTLQPENCMQKVAVTERAMTQVYKTAWTLQKDGLITDKQSRKVFSYLERANNKLDKAPEFCRNDAKDINQLLKTSEKLINKAKAVL